MITDECMKSEEKEKGNKKERRCLQVNYVTFKTDWKVD